MLVERSGYRHYSATMLCCCITLSRRILQIKIEQVDDAYSDGDEVVSRKAGVAIPAANRAQRLQIQGAAERKRIAA